MKTSKRPCTVFFCFTIFLFAAGGICLFFLPQHTYSENENRYLATFQPPTFAGFLDTSFQENLTDASNDQFAGRDFWIKSASSLQYAMGSKDINGVYIGKGGYYFERILDSQVSENRYQNNLSILDEFALRQAKQGTKTFFLPVPPKNTILSGFLPSNAICFDAGKFFRLAAGRLQKAACIDIRPQLESGSQTTQVYFKTDHHWTMDGAYLAYTAFNNLAGAPVLPLAHFSPKCASKKFLGTLYSKAPFFDTEPDQFFLPVCLASADIWIDSKKTASLYEWSKLKEKDKYGVYFGGNFGIIQIQMPQIKSGKKLVIVKDSFANSLTPFLMEHYSEITLLDLRYYNHSVSGFLQGYKPDEVLVLYELGNFAQDMNFFKILN